MSQAVRPIQRAGSRMQWIRMVEQNGVQVRSSYHAHRPATASRDHMRWFSRRLRRRFSIVLDSITPTNPASNFVFRCTNQTRAHDDECRER